MIRITADLRETVIAIAHRLSTLQQFDRIVVMASGRVVEQGSHVELLARGGRYAEMRAGERSATSTKG